MSNIINLHHHPSLRSASAPAMETRYAPTSLPGYPDGIPYRVPAGSPPADAPHVPEKSDKALDACARRAARAAGYVARKSRWRRDSLDNYGEFMVVDPSTNFPVAGCRYDMTAAEVIVWCKEDPDEAAASAG